MPEAPHHPPAGITFLAGLDRDLRAGLAAEVRALWTHSSTALEGNTLTLGDTAFVLQEGLTVSGKSLKDHQEVVGHARAIDLLYAIIDQHRPVTADDLHVLHRAVQTEVDVDAFNPTGRWKVEPNGTTALLTSGSTHWHDYAQPAHVPTLMDAWLDLLDRARRPDAGDPMDGYTDLQLGFTAIHPYADGNGRMARLLANIPVIERGEAPVLIPAERRRDYITRMGDWSIARGAPQPGEALVPRIAERDHLSTFFHGVTEAAQRLVVAYRARQAERDRPLARRP
jgi:Fic family protein